MLRTRFAVAAIVFLLFTATCYPQEKAKTENPSPRELEAVREHEKATRLLLDGKDSEALVLLKKAIDLNPEFSEAYYNLGITYERLGKHKDAIKALKRVLQLSPDDANAYYAIGYAYYQRKKYKEAVEAFDHSISLKPNNAFAFSKLGYTYLAMGKGDKAREQYEVLKQLDKKLADELYHEIGKRENR